MTKKDAYYFSHDANAQDDHKCMVLIDQLGMEGYGIFWALIEKLRSEKDYKLPLNVCSSFAKRWGTSKEKIEAVIKNYNLFMVDELDYFFSLRLKTSMELKTEKAIKSISARWNNTNVIQPNTNVIQKDTIKVKESKGKENNIKPVKISFDKSEIFDKLKFKDTFPDWSKEKLKHYYEAAERYSGEGNKYVNWAKAIQGWASKDELQGKLKFNIHIEETETERKIREFKERGF
jgi:hypothetical protein